MRLPLHAGRSGRQGTCERSRCDVSVKEMATTGPSADRPQGQAGTTGQAPRQRGGRQRLMMLLILAVCVAPVIASYLLYYVFPPGGRTNYGELIQPQRPVPALELVAPGGEPYRFDSLRGRWVLLQVDAGSCDTPCLEKLFMIRQLRTMTGKERHRIDRVWLVTDDAAIDPRVQQAYEGTLMLRADRDQLVAWLPVAEGAAQEGFIYLVDPLGNLMMRFPLDADPGKVRKDLGKLLKASRVG
jgi:hypothetical protein